MATKRLDEEYHFDSKTPIYGNLNRMLSSIEARLQGIEDLGTTLEQVVEDVRTVALTRLDETFTPLILNAQQRLEEFGANFQANSDTNNTIGLGTKTFFLHEDQKAGYVFADFVAIRSVADPANNMTAEVTSYDRDLGILVINSVVTQGAGTFDDWDIRITAAPDLVHAARTDNPHEVTAAQVGAYTAAEVDGLVSGVTSAALLRASNLSDVASPASARGSLGLGSSATHAASLGGQADNVLLLNGQGRVAAEAAGIGWMPQGRLTLETGVPFNSAPNVTAGTNLYYAPYNGPLVPIFDGTNVVMRNILSASNGVVGLGLTMAGDAVFAAGIYDVFAAIVSGTLYFGLGPVWTSAADGGGAARDVNGGLARVWGLQANTSTMSLRTGVSTTVTVPVGQATWLGTILLSPAGSSLMVMVQGGALVAGGALGRCYLWNAYNQRALAFDGVYSATGYPNTVQSWRSVLASNNQRLRVVSGRPTRVSVKAVALATSAPNATAFGVGVGFNATNLPDQNYGYWNPSTGAGTSAQLTLQAVWDGNPMGVNSLYQLEFGHATIPPVIGANSNRISGVVEC